MLSEKRNECMQILVIQDSGGYPDSQNRASSNMDATPRPPRSEGHETKKNLTNKTKRTQDEEDTANIRNGVEAIGNGIF